MAHPTAHGTLTAATVATETLEWGAFIPAALLVVANHSGSDDLWYTFDGSDPAAAADGSYWVGPGQSGAHEMQVRRPSGQTDDLIVKLISAGTPSYSVQVY